ncbi:isoleucine--tRNA ligase, cytoplasmic isoform X2 [Selaginella moellendorffii]|uniref:isoleucine--tRNA ligase, cytoplasmic isoform X2 n=1 Tax=Selaginella moellendorffii TaxID=88036 RepID=UPI000D1C2F5F|nr:isoleucine--tRNA ligase, cytoplasmic isoform X2 [Selaginella moellendorffii]|eukprot:XP_024517008.1 isoleucine--tRNA ligase, cytoplasmic isoform X2 [Selaginella moellendorffii]
MIVLHITVPSIYHYTGRYNPPKQARGISRVLIRVLSSAASSPSRGAMESVPEGKDFSFPKKEEEILQLWSKLDAFQTQLKRSEGRPEYVFYDGPPFATGLPHYGHILAGTIKDIVTRYQSAVGFHVTRRFGWDCHGLPVEHEVDGLLGIKRREDVIQGMGIAEYNEQCRSIVMRYSREWEKTVVRMGRWIDFEKDYKTMDPEFMESVWWVFKQLFEKGLVYRGFKVMPYSTACTTPLSNFEANQNYKEVDDPAIMVAFPLLDDSENAALVAWTTTPWTLPSNIALCVNASLNYVKVRSKSTSAVYIVAEPLLSSLPTVKVKADKGSKKESQSDYEILSKFPGSALVGKRYKPLFNYFLELSDTAFRVVADDYVTASSGTGVVHCAPAFGEDDYRVCMEAGIIAKGGDLPDPVDLNGNFTDKVTHFSGCHVKSADKDIIAMIKAMGRLVNSGSIRHSYPFCWRSETPLIYKAVPSWFVKVEELRDRLLQNTAETYWVPDFVKEKRFHNWLENARDWAVSRSRFWGTPLPIWASSDGEELVVVGSRKELEELSGHKATDIHRHFIDDITIPSKTGRGVLHRVDDVFDCWFESGSMPYAYIHYPFENRELFDKNFPGHFVAEGLDQTRGWFYTLMVLSTALFDKPAFRNLICNGLVLAEDGKKMSKKLKNYPPPMDVVHDYGADALRLYLINSPVVRAEPLKFRKEGVHAVVRDVFLPWYNAYRFLVQNALRLQVEGFDAFIPLDESKLDGSTNVLDRWINSSTQSLVKFVREEMGAYRLYTVVPYLLKFIDNLTNIYVRFNRKRLKGRTGDHDCRVALSTLYSVLLTTCRAMAPFTPFFTEVLYQNLKRVLEVSSESIHYCDFPQVQGQTDERIEQSVSRMMTVIELARNIREKHKLPLKAPLRKMIIVHPDREFLEDLTEKLGEYVREEMNVKELEPCDDPFKYACLRAIPNFSALGKRVGKAMGEITAAVKDLSQDDILEFEKRGEAVLAGQTLVTGDLKIVRDFKFPDGIAKEDIDAGGDGDVVVILDLRGDDTLNEEGIAREVVNRIQKLRKKAKLEPTDAVEVFIKMAADSALSGVVKSQASYIQESLGFPLLFFEQLPSKPVVIAEEEFSGVSDVDFKLVICTTRLAFDDTALMKLCSDNPELVENVKAVLLSRDMTRLKAELQANKSKLQVRFDGQEYDVIRGKHFHLSVSESLSS